MKDFERVQLQNVIANHNQWMHLMTTGAKPPESMARRRELERIHSKEISTTNKGKTIKVITKLMMSDKYYEYKFIASIDGKHATINELRGAI